MREKFRQQLEEMYHQMVVMGGLCQQAIAVAVKTLEEEEDTAEGLEAQVFALDGEIDDMEREIEALCTKLLLRQQPVAKDLRRITAALKMVTDLERIGDQASDIAELARFIRKGSSQHEPPQPDGHRRGQDDQRQRGGLHPPGHRPGPGRSSPTTTWWTSGLTRSRPSWSRQIATDKEGGEELLDVFMVAKYSRAHRRPRHQPGRVGGVRRHRRPVQGRPLGGARRAAAWTGSRLNYRFNLEHGFAFYDSPAKLCPESPQIGKR